MKKIQKPRAVCILGMHRSGTSMTTRILNLIGVQLGNPDQIISSGGKFNEKGFWEHKGIMRTQQKLLMSFQRSWDTTRPLPRNWWKSSKVKPYKSILSSILKKDFEHSKVWGWKDPRTCILLPMWKELLKENNVEPVYVIVVRNPLDVAHSLQRRNNFPIEKSLDIWLLYVLSSLLWSQTANRVIIDYNDFLTNWESQVEMLANELQLPSPTTKSIDEIKTFITPALSHSNSTYSELSKNEEIPKKVKEVYSLIQEAIESKEFDSTPFSDKIKQLYRTEYFAKRK